MQERIQMAGHWRWGVAALLSAGILATTAQAQALQRSEVLGAWTLRMTPAEGGSARITIKTDTGRLDMPVTITARGASGLDCVVDGEPAECRVRRGELTIALRMDDTRMTFTLNSRRGSAFSGNARLAFPLLPFGSMQLGTASLTRR
ncbi:MAG: hypothetical protein EON59_15795 [Alphaproteobacteria bacterium]|nr:MAG: hypothetical protein EON59_15795 [Alphaproteobacteria bacterium]